MPAKASIELATFGTLVAALTTGALAAPQTRPTATNWTPPPIEGGATTADLSTLTPQDLVSELLGPGVLVSNVSYTGAPVAAGTFTGGTGVIGFERGVVLSSGNVATIGGPDNTLDDATTNNGVGGDAGLEALGVGTTYDAASLEFDFECPTSTTISFQFVLMSEEYNEYVYSAYNDAFALFLNGTNIAIVPGSGIPVSINNVNCGNPYDPLGGTNCSLFINNDCDDLPLGACPAISTEMDGLTTVFSATGTIQPGVNHLRLVVADVGDSAFDSNVVVRGQSLVCAAPAPAFDPPTPCGETLAVEVGSPVAFTAVAIATSGLPGQTVSINATGSAAALGGGTFTPALPTTPAATSTTDFAWTPMAGDVGSHTITLVATDQIGQSTECDVEILVVPAGSIGDSICDPNEPNSSGLSARLWAVGSDVASDNDLTLHLVDAPAGVFALAVNSQEMNVVVNPGGSMGSLCIASSSMGRHNQVALTSSPGGQGEFVIDLTAIPYEPGTSTAVLAGETWYWQTWYRDTVSGAPTANWSNAVRVTFQ